MSDNYYILLGLDPKVDDWTVIEGVIKECQRRWSMQKNQGRPEDRRKADRYVRLIPDMQVKLKDSAERRKIAGEAAELLKDKKAERYKRLDQLIQFMDTSTIDPADVKLLVRQVGGGIGESEVLNRLKKKGISVAPTEKAKGPTKVRPKLDPTIDQNIRDNLQHLELPSLYGFLGIGPRSSPKRLVDAADEIYKEIRRKGLTDPDSNARQELAGYAKAVFKNNLEKEKYDNAYAVQAMEDLRGLLEVAGRDSFLEQNEIDRLIKEARSSGVAPDIAIDYIEEFARKRKWKVRKEPKPPAVELKLCGFCSTVARTPKETRCHNCGKAFVQPCPRCGKPTPTQDACCGACGCNTGDAPFIHGLLKQGQERMAEGDLGSALSCFDKALIYWEDWQPAIDAKQRLLSIRSARESALKKIDGSLRERKLEEAQSALDRFRRQFGSKGTENIGGRIDEGMRLAIAAFQSAEALQSAGRSEDAVDKYMAALGHCTDFQPALRGLADSPPSAPSMLTITKLGKTAKLSWIPAPASGSVSYRILRKPEGAPTGPDDGEQIGELYETQFHDASVPPGKPWYYSIYTLRGGVASLTASRSGPHMWFAEPTDVIVEAGDGRVTLRWSPPVGCTQVEVWRSVNKPPSKPGTGKCLDVSGDSAVDSDLTNGTKYGYLIVACFADPTDRRASVRSPGVGLTATPVAPPSAVKDLRATRKHRDVMLAWTHPEKGDVQIRMMRQKPEFSPGRIIPLSMAAKYGTPVSLTGRGRAQTTLSGQGRVFFIPLSVVAQTAIMGSPVQVTSLDEITGMESQRQGNDIHLTWEWPPGAVAVVIGWRHDVYPVQPEEATGGRRTVTLSEYNRNGMWVLRKAKRERHYFAIFVYDPDADIFSSGRNLLEASGLETLVSYRVITRRSLIRRRLKKAWMELKSKEKIRAIPALLVVHKRGSPPLRPGDGQTIARISRLSFKAGVARIDLPINGHDGYVKLFFQNGQDTHEFRLLSAPLNQIKIG